MEKAQAIIKKLMNTLCCCFKDKSNPEERLPLKPSQNYQMNPNNIDIPEKPDQPYIDPSFEDIINQISSGDEDDPIDPAQEEKYEQILKGIED